MGIRALLIAAAVLATGEANALKYRIAMEIPLDLREAEPSFVILDHLQLLDRDRLLFYGRPIKQKSTFYVLDLGTLETRALTVPGIPGMQVPPKTLMAVDKPLYYDTANGTAGILLRGGGLVSGEAELFEWDLGQDTEARRVPLTRLAGAPYMGVDLIGYDHERRECFVETQRPLSGAPSPTGQGGRYELNVLGIRAGEAARVIATLRTTNRYTGKSPYYDPIHRRSAHMEYVEIGGETAKTGVHIVDLGTGRVHTIELPRVIYGWDFDPDGKVAYAYSNTTGEVLRFDIETGQVLKRVKKGRFGHGLSFVAPNRLLLMRNARLHLLDSRTLKELDGVNPGAFHKGSTHTEGSIVMPGRMLLRIFYKLYVLDFPTLAPR